MLQKRNVKKNFYLTTAVLLFAYLFLLAVLKFFLPPLNAESFQEELILGSMALMPKDLTAIAVLLRSALQIISVPWAIFMLRKYTYDLFGDLILRKLFTALLVVNLSSSFLLLISRIVNEFSPDAYQILGLIIPCFYFILPFVIAVYMIARVNLDSTPKRLGVYSLFILSVFFLIRSLTLLSWMIFQNERTGLTAFRDALNTANVLMGFLLILLAAIVLIFAYRNTPKWTMSKHDRDLAEYYKTGANQS